MTIKNDIEEKLNKEFSPSSLEIIDESHLHAGHSGSRESGESHFRIRITAQNLRNITRIKQHQAIYTALSHELDSNNPAAIHALAIEVS